MSNTNLDICTSVLNDVEYEVSISFDHTSQNENSTATNNLGKENGGSEEVNHKNCNKFFEFLALIMWFITMVSSLFLIYFGYQFMTYKKTDTSNPSERIFF